MIKFEGMNEFMDSYLLGVLISMGIGLIIGLEREYDKLKDQGFAGIRTFPIVAILGFSLENLTDKFTVWILIVSLGAFILFLAVNHMY
ncbi:MgtC/SapB family protein [Zobellia nedashkovskayae]